MQRGGLDLDTGQNWPSNDTDNIEVRDLGIDGNQPTATNWRRQIESRNNFTMAELIPGQNGLSENFSFDDVIYAEQIAALNGNVVDLPNGQGTVSAQVEQGDIFWGTRGNKYYLFVIKQVVLTADNNDDYYVVDIKVSE